MVCMRKRLLGSLAALRLGSGGPPASSPPTPETVWRWRGQGSPIPSGRAPLSYLIILINILLFCIVFFTF